MIFKQACSSHCCDAANKYNYEKNLVFFFFFGSNLAHIKTSRFDTIHSETHGLRIATHHAGREKVDVICRCIVMTVVGDGSDVGFAVQSGAFGRSAKAFLHGGKHSSRQTTGNTRDDTQVAACIGLLQLKSHPQNVFPTH